MSTPPTTETTVSGRPRHSAGSLILGWVGLLGHLATLVWYMASGLVAPGWAVIVLLVIWLGLLALGIYLLRTRPAWVLAVPVLAAAIWFAAISAGEAWLGWTA
jgi:hypothetical protein